MHSPQISLTAQQYLKEALYRIAISIFAVAFGFVEAAVVVYLRQLLGITQPQIAEDEVLFLLPGIAFLEPKKESLISSFPLGYGTFFTMYFYA